MGKQENERQTEEEEVRQRGTPWDAAAVHPGIDLMAVCQQANPREEIGGSGVVIDHHGNGRW